MAPTDRLDGLFSFAMDFSGPGDETWAFRVANGRCTLAGERAAAADLVMSQAPAALVRTLARLQHRLLARLMGRVRVRGLRKMGTFARLMTPEGGDFSLSLNASEPAAS